MTALEAVAPWFELQEPAASSESSRFSASRVLVLFGTEFRRLEQEYPELAARIQSALRTTAQAA